MKRSPVNAILSQNVIVQHIRHRQEGSGGDRSIIRENEEAKPSLQHRSPGLSLERNRACISSREGTDFLPSVQTDQQAFAFVLEFTRKPTRFHLAKARESSHPRQEHHDQGIGKRRSDPLAALRGGNGRRRNRSARSARYHRVA